MTFLPPARGNDGFYHPNSEEQLIALVKLAGAEGRQLRVRGAVHSVACAIYTDPCTDSDNTVEHESPPPGDNLNVMLDQYRGFHVVDAEKRLVEAQAGINLGHDTSDPTHTSTLENSLLYQLWKDHGWTLSALGGIIHQTVSGFLSTGSSGGSLSYAITDNIYSFRVIDGLGNVYCVSREDDPDTFHAVAVSMGLLGVISTVTLQCVPTFNISGQEAITSYDEASMDFFGAGSDGKLPLEQFLQQVEYCRIEWWPQPGAERLLTWQCQRIVPQPGFRPVRYQEFTNRPEVGELAIGVLYTIIGNLDDLSRAKPKLQASFAQLDQVLTILYKTEGLGEFGKILAEAISTALKVGIDAAITLLEAMVPLLKQMLPEILPKLINTFMPLDSQKSGISCGEPQSFQDYGWRGLPMDHQAIDVLVPMAFTEFWVPLGYTQRAMAVLAGYFHEPSSPQEALARTGVDAWEIYSAMPSPFWMSNAYSDGADVWKDGALRVDIYWSTTNPGNPAEVFYPQFWKLFRDHGIPYRLHWGKYRPIIAHGDPDGWVAFFKQQFARWNDFLALRTRKDPNNIFLSDYWRAQFGLWDDPRPRPIADAASASA